MKKFNYLFLSALMTLCMISFASCSDDDNNDDDNQLAKDIVGKWSLKTGTLTLDCEPKDATDPIKGFYTDEEGAYTYAFSTEGKYIVTDKSGVENDRGTYKVVSNNVELTSSGASPRSAAVEPSANKKMLTNVSVSGSVLSATYDLSDGLKENAKDDKFWEEIDFAKPESFTVNKFTGVYTFSVTKDPK